MLKKGLSFFSLIGLLFCLIPGSAFAKSEDVFAVFGAGIFIFIMMVFVLCVIALSLVIWWKIFEKAGYGGAMGLLMILPIINLVMMCYLAFAEWPILKELKQLRAQRNIPPPTV